VNEPLMDIIIPVHNQGRWVELCVQAVKSFTKTPHRIIIVDNASDEQYTKNLLDKLGKEENVLVIRNPENKSFSNSINVGVAAGSAKNLVILNDDAIVSPGWDQHFLQDLADPSVGMTGARSNYASGRQGMGLAWDDAPFLVFVCVAITRKLWDELGPMDEVTYDGFSTEDLDMSYRVRWCERRVVDGRPILQKANQPIRKLRVSKAFVLHAGSQTLQAELKSLQALDQNNDKYMKRLVAHWGEDFVKKNTKPFPKVLAVSFSAEEWTRVNFMIAFAGLRTGTGFNFACEHITRLPIHLARQVAAEKALAADADYLFMVDDDMVFLPDTLQKLVKIAQENPEVSVINALAYGRKPPYYACIFKQSKNGFGYDNMEGWEDKGVVEVDGTGLSCALIRTDVFRKLDTYYVDKLSPEDRAEVDAFGKSTHKLDEAKDHGHKWWRPLTKLELAQLKSHDWFGSFEKLGEDLFFCRRAKDAGFKIHVDTDQVIGHIGEPEIVGRRVKRAYLERQAQAMAMAERVNG